MIWACVSKLQDPEQGIQITINEQQEATVLNFLRGLQAAVIQLVEECHGRDHEFLSVGMKTADILARCTCIS